MRLEDAPHAEARMPDSHLPAASVVDLFCGAGGLSYGFRQERFALAAGLDIDPACRYAYETNNAAPFLRADVSRLQAEALQGLFAPGTRRILVGCAPCQPFSSYSRKPRTRQWRLLNDFGRLIADVRPDVASMENVPRLRNFRQGRLFRDFVAQLQAAGYEVAQGMLFGPDYGLPQTRTRLVLIASRLGSVTLPPPTHTPDRYPALTSAIGTLPRLRAGAVDPKDALHRARNLSPLNLQRIQVSRPGGTWQDWPAHLVTPCHRRRSGRTFSSVYGRLEWHKPAPTLTTQFYNFGSGRFGHPDQDRALSLREGALLQSFPPSYAFVPPQHPIEFASLGRMIGNAVPVVLARALARAIKSHLQEHA